MRFKLVPRVRMEQEAAAGDEQNKSPHPFTAPLLPKDLNAEWTQESQTEGRSGHRGTSAPWVSVSRRGDKRAGPAGRRRAATMDQAELCFPQLNTSCSRRMRPRSKLGSALLSLVTVLTVVLNLLVLVSISHFRHGGFTVQSQTCVFRLCVRSESRFSFQAAAHHHQPPGLLPGRRRLPRGFAADAKRPRALPKLLDPGRLHM